MQFRFDDLLFDRLFEEKRWRAQIKSILWFLIPISLFMALLNVMSYATQQPQPDFYHQFLLLNVGYLAGTTAVIWLLWHDHVTRAAQIFVAISWSGVIIHDLIHDSGAMTSHQTLLVAVAISGFLLGRRGLLIITSITLLYLLAATQIYEQNTFHVWLGSTAGVCMITLVVMVVLTRNSQLTKQIQQDTLEAVLYDQRLVLEVEEKERAQNALQSLFDNSIDMIMVIDEQGYLVRGNPALTQVLGYTIEELKAKPLIEFVHPEDQRATADARRQLDTGAQAGFFENRYIHKDGSDRWLSWTFFADTRWIYAIVRDVTEAKRLEAEEDRLKAERQAVEVRQRFVSKISHELRTPLAVIQSSRDLIVRYQHKLPPERVVSQLDKIGNQIDVMTEIIDDVLLINKLNTGVIQPEPGRLELDDFCAQVFEYATVCATEAHEIIYENHSERECIYTDAKFLRRILSNLLTNAVKYSPDGGKIRLSIEDQGENVVFTIRDEGLGIPEAHLKNLFEPFQRASNVGSIEGTGLGLSIVRESVEQQGGKISCQNNPGHGTIFTVELPANDETDVVANR